MIINAIALPTLIVSTLAVLTSNSWLLIWISLEINTLAFCSFALASPIKENNTTESVINYFVIQSAASAIIIMYITAPAIIKNSDILFISGTVAILMNLGAAPFHSWFLEIIPSLEINTSLILITWQKLAPAYILIFIMNSAVLASIVVSAVVGSINQITNNKLIEVLALSSIFNLSWTIAACILSTNIIIAFILAYWLSVWSVITLLSNHNIISITIDSASGINPWTLLLVMASLAGLPPTLGFYANIQVVLEILNNQMNEIATFLLVISAINFFVYLRTTTPSILIAPANRQNNNECNSEWAPFIILLNTLPIALITL